MYFSYQEATLRAAELNMEGPEPPSFSCIDQVTTSCQTATDVISQSTQMEISTTDCAVQTTILSVAVYAAVASGSHTV